MEEQTRSYICCLWVFPPFASVVCCLHRNEVTNHDVTRHDVTKALAIRMPQLSLWKARSDVDEMAILVGKMGVGKLLFV